MSDAVVEARTKIRFTDATSKAWVGKVEPMVLNLVLHTLPEFTGGWGSALGNVFVGFWLLALGQLAVAVQALNNPLLSEQLPLMMTVVLLCIPLALAADAAAASSDCRSLVRELNRKRAADLSAEAHVRIPDVCCDFLQWSLLLLGLDPCCSPCREDFHRWC